MVDVAQPGERIPIASDHAGFELKERLRTALAEMGYTVADIGTHSTASTDYPDYAHPLAQEVSDGQSARGVLLCGTGMRWSAAGVFQDRSNDEIPSLQFCTDQSTITHGTSHRVRHHDGEGECNGPLLAQRLSGVIPFGSLG